MNTARVRIWDLPTRLFHWLLALCVAGLFVTGKSGGEAMNWHFLLGYAALTLLLFRLVWGFAGGRWSRFASFFPTPARLRRYLTGRALPEDGAGHNPLGALSVFALLALLAAQAISGLFANDEIAFAGPLSGLLSGRAVNQISGLHKTWGQYLLIALIALHVLAIIVYTARRHRLLWPMIAGDKEVAADLPPSRDTVATRALALAVLAALALAVYALVAWGNAQAAAGFGY